MTVTYVSSVATTSKGISCFWRLLFRWRGSLYKLVWREFLVYIIFYISLSLLYRLGLTEDQKRVFEKMALLVNQSSQLIPMTFVLGFYVSLVMSRWWDMYISIPWPDSIALYISTNIIGTEEKVRIARRTMMRYINLTFALTLAEISPKMKKRIPTLEHLVAMGLLTDEELEVLKNMEADQNEPKPPIYWVPILWAIELGFRSLNQGMLKDDFSARSLGEKLNGFRSSCGNLLNYDYINIPLVYTQVVTIAVYTFFLSTILGRQFLDPAQNIEGHSFDVYVPVYTLMQFFFYMGWLKVGENLSNPFGEDDDDFDVCFLLDRNIKVSYIIVDSMHGSCPRATKDLYFKDVVPRKLLYTQASDQFRVIPKHGSGTGTFVEGQDLLLDDADVEWYENSLLVTLDGDDGMCCAVPGDSQEGNRKPQGQCGVSSDVLNDVVLQIIPDSNKDARKGRAADGRKTQDQRQQQRPRWAQGLKKGAVPDGRRNYSVDTLRKRRADALERTGQQQRLLQQQRQQEEQRLQDQQQDSRVPAVIPPQDEVPTEEA